MQGRSWFLLLTLVLAGCAATGENLRSNTYTAAEVNKAQNAEVIEIISVMDAKVVVDNSEQKRKAQTGGATLGALAGGLGGGLGGLSAGGTAGTTVAGGAIGVAAGSMVSETVMVDGVTIGFRKGAGGQVMTSSQVGRKCEFQPGTALLVSTGSRSETRIQPNATCPTGK